MNAIKVVSILLVLTVLNSCTKEEDSEPTNVTKADLSITVSTEVDGERIVFYNLDEKKYANLAGNIWEVTRLEYYLGDFAFQKANGEWIKVYSMPELINAQKEDRTFILSGVPVGNYTGISFMVGIPPEQNKTGFLENTLDNLNMAWPENLHGGYHYMKFEGNYIDEDDKIVGFTVHLGDIGKQSVNVIENTDIPISTMDNSILLTMDPNEWFESPYTYDFNVDGNYTMAIDSLMELISKNGQNCMSLKSPI